MQITSKNRSKKMILVGGAVLLFAGIGVFAFYTYSNSENDVRRNQSGTSLERSKQESEETKDIQNNPEDAKQQTGSDTVAEPAVDSSTGMHKVNVILTNTGTANGTVDASGFVSNIVEEGGTCTFVFTQNQRIIKKTSTTSVNPTSTTCLTIRFSEKELGPGEWKVIIQYNSANASGASNEGTLVIK